jgi:hypothetical protein
VENGTRSYAAMGAGAGVSSSLTFDELGSETSCSGLEGDSLSDPGPAEVEAFEGLFLFLLVLPSGLGGLDTADMLAVF